MIQTDKEIERQIELIDQRIYKKIKEIKIKEILCNQVVFGIIFLLQLIILIKGIYNFVNNLTLFVIVFIIYFVFLGLLLDYCINSLEKDLKTNKKELDKLNAAKEALLDFTAYIFSCRHINSVKEGKNLYPEMRYNDSLSVYNELNKKYKEKASRYENGDKIWVLIEIENEILGQE